MKKIDPIAFRSEVEKAQSCWFVFRRTEDGHTSALLSYDDKPDTPTYKYIGPHDITIRQERDGKATVTRFSLEPDNTPKGDPA